MTTFSKANFKSLNYNSFRPKYPPTFYKILSQYASKGDESKLPLEKSIDLGCGTGVATYPLLNISNEVIGLDLSLTMVETANSLIDERTKQLGVDKSRISFKTGAVEDFLDSKSQDIQQNSVDLITAAQCIHWFQDFPKFFENSYKILKQGGTLAYFFYCDPIIVDYHIKDANIDSKTKLANLEQAKQLYNKYIYDDPNFVGPHWEQPGRNILKFLLQDVNKAIPEDLYDDVIINNFLPDIETGAIKPGPQDLNLTKENISIEELLNYLYTYSGYHNFKEKTGDKVNVYQQLTNEYKTLLGWDENTTIDIVWNTGYTFLTKK